MDCREIGSRNIPFKAFAVVHARDARRLGCWQWRRRGVDIGISFGGWGRLAEGLGMGCRRTEKSKIIPGFFLAWVTSCYLLCWGTLEEKQIFQGRNYKSKSKCQTESQFCESGLWERSQDKNCRFGHLHTWMAFQPGDGWHCPGRV